MSPENTPGVSVPTCPVTHVSPLCRLPPRKNTTKGDTVGGPFVRDNYGTGIQSEDSSGRRPSVKDTRDPEGWVELGRTLKGDHGSSREPSSRRSNPLIPKPGVSRWTRLRGPPCKSVVKWSREHSGVDRGDRETRRRTKKGSDRVGGGGADTKDPSSDHTKSTKQGRLRVQLYAGGSTSTRTTLFRPSTPAYSTTTGAPSLTQERDTQVCSGPTNFL